MATGKRNSKVNSRSRLIFLVIIAVLIIAIIVVAKNIITLRMEKARLEEQEQALQSKKDELTAELQGVDQLDYIEEQARKLLKMIKPGEVLYILNGDDPRPEGSSSSNGETIIPPSITADQSTTQDDSSDYDGTYDEPVYEEPTYEEPTYDDSTEAEDQGYYDDGSESSEYVDDASGYSDSESDYSSEYDSESGSGEDSYGDEG